MSVNYDSFFVPRILLISDGEADNQTWQTPLQVAVQQRIIIDVVALLSQDERGRKTLEEIAQKTGGSFILPQDLNKFVTEFVQLSKKKQATKVEDVILCLDTSGSMSENYKGSSSKKINALKDAVKEFASKKLAIDPRDRVGVVVFGTHELTKVDVLLRPGPYSAENFQRVVDRLKAQDGTPLDRGLDLAIRELDLVNKRNRMTIETVQPIRSIQQFPNLHGTCGYCAATGKPQPDINAENWTFYEGVRKVHVFRCPRCGIVYHGSCFDRHITRGGNYGVCYGCNAILGVEQALQVQTPATATSAAASAELLLMCPNCNEPLPPAARFCAHCGQKIDADHQPVATQATAATYSAGDAGGSGGGGGSADSIYNPEKETLVACPRCGYSCQASWGTCPMCDAPLPRP
ncbi:MAG: VWA domain-containing protein [Candidatus Lokiarchaeota archaeon]|nr:VWA domain-containing protein [Candidatus Lokiarchaeota archaeon]